MAGARGIEPRSKVLETFILTVVLCPLDWQYNMLKIHYCHLPRAFQEPQNLL
jgi:hypothetical protein